MSKLSTNIKVHEWRSGSSSIAGRVLLGASIFCGFMSFYSYFKAYGAESEIEFRKRQLKLPIIKLTDEQLVSPPWNDDNI